MQIQFTYHALERLQERKIAKKEIRKTISQPDKKATKNEVQIAMKLRKNRHLLIVVYTEVKSICKIITIIDTSKVQKYL